MSAMKAKQTEGPLSSNQAMWAGILFSLVFTGIIWVARPYLPQIDFAPDTGASHYYWKLPNPTAITRASAWISYLVHQGFMWFLIYKAQKDGLKYTGGLHRVNVIALVGNALFVVWHLLQTAFWYDGLAQDVSIWSSQISVIIMLVMILHMENKRRGLFFGRKLNFLNETGDFLRRYHGYIFSWAIVYTFWYHPMENTNGHLIGFFYMFMLMLQGCLFFTRMHVNKYWTFSLEIMVLFHGSLVALEQGIARNEINSVWPMFFFGFAGLFVVTQMYGIGLKQWQRYGFLGLYVAAVLGWYGSTDIVAINEVIRIPAIEYLAVFVSAGLVWLVMRLTGWQNKRTGRVAAGD